MDSRWSCGQTDGDCEVDFSLNFYRYVKQVQFGESRTRRCRPKTLLSSIFRFSGFCSLGLFFLPGVVSCVVFLKEGYLRVAVLIVCFT